MTLIAVQEAFDRLLVGAETVQRNATLPLAACSGRVLAQDVVAGRTQPPFDASAMDGYALSAADGNSGRVLEVIGTSAAGAAFNDTVSEGQAVRIFTGAPVPAGADTILIQENAEALSGPRVRVIEPVEAGRHIRAAGCDFLEGAVLLEAGTRLTPGAIALAASGGHPALRVIARPKVMVIATGDELVMPGEATGPSQIVASNSFGIAAMVEEAGGDVVDGGIVGDEEEHLAARLDVAIAEKVDIVVTIGGASVGDRDLVGKVLADHGVDLAFWKVAMRPGKPLMAGRLGPIHILGLPGNPASSMVTARLFLVPLVGRLAGRAAEGLEETGRLGAEMPENDHRTDFIRATIEIDAGGDRTIHPLPRQDSSLLSIYAAATALLIRPPHAPKAASGEFCRFIRL